MKIRDIVEAQPSNNYCNTTPPSKMSASWKSSCKAKGHVSRDTKKTYLNPVTKKRVTARGKIKSKEKGNPQGPSETNTG